MARSSEELDFLRTYDPGSFERPSVAVDVVLLTVRDGAMWTLLYQRTEHPDRGRYALPGGFVGIEESLEDAVARQLKAKAAVEGVFVEQLYTFGAPDRDPRMRIIAAAHYALVPAAVFDGATGLQGRVRVPWEGEVGGPVEVLDGDGDPYPLAFDHADMLGLAVQRIRGKLSYVPIAFELLPASFTLLEARRVYEAIWGRDLNKDSFRKTLLGSGLIEATGERQSGVGHRPAALYRRWEA
ncbi:MAG: NUDIX domain-containing protein [Proteobacteria bacterium]|nr:NUDIX domain-containing protein [Pseudomonadota bacterium]